LEEEIGNRDKEPIYDFSGSEEKEEEKEFVNIDS
jgi:hypothetical protein